MNFGVLDRRRWLIIPIIISIIAGLLIPIPGSVPTPPDGNPVSLSSVTIKTQTAANNVPNGIRGIDVSEYQGTINWEKVAGDNVKFAICRASYGLKADKNFYINARGAHANGLLVGAYHYAKFTDRATMIKEADYFLSLVKNVEISYPVFVDIEANRGLSRDKLTELAIEFMEKIRAAGYTPMLYSYTNFYRDYLNVKALGDYALWVANYLEEPKIGQKLWQHTSYGTVSGIKGRVDINIAYEDLATKKKIRVSREISNSIKATLNERHGSGLPDDGLDMTQMREAVVTALQSELIRQLNANIAVTGVMDADTLNALEQVPFNLNETKGNMTYLIQVMLFYKGHYTQALNGMFDDEMSAALESYQRAASLTVTGTPTRDALWYLFS